MWKHFRMKRHLLLAAVVLQHSPAWKLHVRKVNCSQRCSVKHTPNVSGEGLWITGLSLHCGFLNHVVMPSYITKPFELQKHPTENKSRCQSVIKSLGPTLAKRERERSDRMVGCEDPNNPWTMKHVHTRERCVRTHDLIVGVKLVTLHRCASSDGTTEVRVCEAVDRERPIDRPAFTRQSNASAYCCCCCS